MESLHSVTWLAVSGKSVDAVCHDLGLRETGSVTRRGRFAIEGARSAAGWFLIVAQGRDHRLIQPPVLSKLSMGCEVLTCTIDERILSSVATGWANGHRLWSITYEGEERPGEVLAEGQLPIHFASIQRDLAAKSQAEDAGDLLVDPLFEIPIETVRHPIGFRPDEPSPAFDGRFVALHATDPTFMQRLFGG